MIVLLTDFGLVDPYVGIMKAVIRSYNPTVEIVDLSHNVSPFHLRQAACMLEDSWPHFPKKSLFLSVVDPGVGSQRNAIFLIWNGLGFVGPDNGIFTEVLKQKEVVAFKIPVEKRASPTFHGRDVFAPFAARILKIPEIMYSLEPLNPDNLIRLPETKGFEIYYADHFGNLITNQKHKNLSRKKWELSYEGKTLPKVKTFSELKPQEIGVYFGSSGRLEIAIREGSAKNLNPSSFQFLVQK
ncbi:MAG: SAM-dependent chlorinase/fluorinase [Candidatus Cloacimonetes bacterium]|nr:SAM-dependent chlorinase/fluorinase [Candidatus Cloacimonadota bacterium]